MKKIFSLLLIFAVSLLTITTSASATTIIEKKENSTKNSEIVVSEGEIIKVWLSSSDEELEKMGYTTDQITEIRSYNFEKLFLERASLAIDELQNYGYSSDQINILKNYDGSTITANSPVLLAASDMVIFFTNSGNYSNTSATYVNVVWEWSSVPLMKLTDVFAVAFKGVNSNGNYIDVTPSTRTAKVKYYVQSTGKY